METDCNTFRFQDFPSDLTRSIFEASAEDLNWGCALVSKMVKSWVEPILYRQIILDKPTTVSLLHRTIVSSVSSKPPHFFASHVKSLGVFFSNDSWEELMEILATCSGISRLEFTMYLDEDLNRDDLRVGRHRAWEHLRPTSLHIPGTLFLPTHRHFHFLPWEGKTLNPIFTRITHFEIDWNSIRLTTWSWESLSLLSTLTHLCISSLANPEVVDLASSNLRSAVLYFPTSLVVCIFFIPNTHWFVRARQLVEENSGRRGNLDGRVVVAVDRDYYFAELAKGVEGRRWIEKEAIWRSGSGAEEAGKDNEEAFWEQAEALAVERARGDHQQ